MAASSDVDGDERPSGEKRSVEEQNVSGNDTAWLGLAATEQDPIGGECAAVSLSGDRMLVFGGRNASDLFNEAFVYDEGTSVWAKLPTTGITPRARAGHALVVYGSDLVMVSYGMNQDVGYLSDVCLLDTASKVWSHAAISGVIPSARDKLAAAVVGTRVFLHGGFGVMPNDDESEEEEEGAAEDEGKGGSASVNMGWHADLHAFDTATHRIALLQPAGPSPPARAAHSLVALDAGDGGDGGALFLFGGRTQLGRADDLWRLDLASLTWRCVVPAAASPSPSPRSFHRACAIDGSRFVVFGGLDARDAHANDLHVFDARSERWLRPQLSSAPSPRGSCALSATRQSLLLFGGSAQWRPDDGAPSAFLGDLLRLPLRSLEHSLLAASGCEGASGAPAVAPVGEPTVQKRARMSGE